MARTSMVFEQIEELIWNLHPIFVKSCRRFQISDSEIEEVAYATVMRVVAKIKAKEKDSVFRRELEEQEQRLLLKRVLLSSFDQELKRQLSEKDHLNKRLHRYGDHSEEAIFSYGVMTLCVEILTPVLDVRGIYAYLKCYERVLVKIIAIWLAFHLKQNSNIYKRINRRKGRTSLNFIIATKSILSSEVAMRGP